MSTSEEPMSVHGTDTIDGPLDIEFDVTPVSGDAGGRLGPRQAEAILDVVMWLCAHTADTSGQPQE